ncbi:MAG: polysaccharide biosynthesis/export family protein [Dysgonamonadaceae bacterium]|jgi:polysaccharide export outer membrane protein|nr:polysaccharide biosynthesis/export family protein [Dysgonamonadaceae bacterium]
MKLNLNILKVFSLLLLLCAASCTSYKKVPYFQVEGEQPGAFETSSYASKSVVRFQPDDVLAITVNVVGEQKIALDYNLPIQPSATSFGGEGTDVNTGIGRQTYLVSKAGEIDFPTLGIIKAAGYSQEELQDYIKQLLRERMKIDPIVTVRLMNFKILVMGEVNRPGQITVSKDRIDLFEAIALAGDLTIFGKRDNVFVRRQLPDGTFRHVKLDISKADVSTSPYFYLQQNDMIYVQPTKTKTLQSDISLWSTVINVASFLISLATFVAYTSRNN